LQNETLRLQGLDVDPTLMHAAINVRVLMGSLSAAEYLRENARNIQRHERNDASRTNFRSRALGSRIYENAAS